MERIRLFFAAGAIMATAAFGRSAHAAFVGLTTVLEFPNHTTPVGQRDVYHVFAEFTSPTDRVNSWFGTAQDPFVIRNVLADGATLGSNFTNLGGQGGNLPPETPGTVRDWDTFATIGIRDGSEAPSGIDEAILSVPFPNFISGNSVTAAASISVPPTAPQGRADYRVLGGDTNMRVLLMQLVVNLGQHVRGTISVTGQASTPLGVQDYTAINQTFNSVPSPNAVALLGTFLLCYKRRRRSE